MVSRRERVDSWKLEADLARLFDVGMGIKFGAGGGRRGLGA